MIYRYEGEQQAINITTKTREDKLPLYLLDLLLRGSIQHKDTSVTAMYLDYKNKNYTREEIDSHNETEDLLSLGLAHPSLERLKFDYNIKIKDFKKITLTMFLGNSLRYKNDLDYYIIPSATREGSKIDSILVVYK